METFAYCILTILILFLICIFIDPKPMSVEDRYNLEKEMESKEKELKHIYWKISEIERLSNEKTIAIRNGDMELYKKLCIENDLLKTTFK